MVKKLDKATDKNPGKSTPQKGVVAVVSPLKIKAAGVLTATSAAIPEDDFSGLYWDGVTGNILHPPYDMLKLKEFGENNNTLDPCVTAYVNNIDGSGYVIEKEGEVIVPNEEDTDPTAQELYDFFGEISPGMSLVTLRKECRRDLEYTGNAFLEVVRNVDSKIVFINRIESHMMRLVKLGEPHLVPYVISRFGEEMTVSMFKRERLYAQRVGSSLIYFKEFGAVYDVNRKTGAWSEKKLAVTERGNEIIHLTVNKSATTSYGVPRWINQIPSITGSRMAEEANIGYFESGGIPPVLVFIAGGSMELEVRKQLLNVFNQGAAKGHRGAVIELTPTGGSLDKDGKVDVKVEKFGSEAMKDSMFEGYDDKCDKRVRKSFRLPPLFTGMADDYSFASAYASYLVAEAQVFGPERFEWDEMFNMTIMRVLDETKTYRVRSKQVSVKDIETQLKGLVMLKGLNGVAEKEYVAAVNETANLNVQHDETLENEVKEAKVETENREFDLKSKFMENKQKEGAGAKGTKPPFMAKPKPVAPNGKKPKMVAKSELLTTSQLCDLVDAYLGALGLAPTSSVFTKEDRDKICVDIDALDFFNRTMFDTIVSARLNKGEDLDPEGSRDLIHAAIEDELQSIMAEGV